MDKTSLAVEGARTRAVKVRLEERLPCDPEFSREVLVHVLCDEDPLGHPKAPERGI